MKQIYLLLVLSLCSINSFAQHIKGEVRFADTKELIPGVTVVWKGSNKGTFTDKDGKFNIEKPEDAHMLQFSYLGTETKTMHIDKHSYLRIELEKSSELVDEVVVGGRQQSAGMSMLTPNAVQKITGKELARAACCNLSESFETNASVDVNYADAVSGVKQIQLLGLAGKYAQLTMNNVPILRGAESAFGLEYFPGTWINSIQVSKGTAAVKNGYESITGQINIDVKEPSGAERFFFNTYGNQDGKAELNVGYTADLSHKLSTSFMVHGNKNFRKLDMNQDNFLDKPLSDMLVLMNQWNYQGEIWESKFGFTFLNDQRQGGQKNFNHKHSMEEQPDVYGIDVDVKRFNVFAKNGFMLNRDASSIGTILSYNYFNRESFYGHNVFNVTQQNLYANFIYASYLFDTRHVYNIGASFNYDKNDAEFSQLSNYHGYEEHVTGVFAEYTYMPSEKFTLLMGARYDYSSLYNGFFTPRIHAKYSIGKNISLRASAGKGYRTPDVISENSKYMASAKHFLLDDTHMKQEEAWNYGLSVVNNFTVNNRPWNIYLEYYRTDFTNQLVADMEQNSHEIHFYNLEGKSYSNIFQIESSYEVFKRFTLTAAYRYNDVKITYGNELKEAPFTNKYKGLLSASYATNLNKWQFDFTAQFNGNQRLPSTADNAAENRRADYSDNYVVLLAQITKNYRNWSFYVGGENLSSYTQQDAIIAPESPFSNDFDASRIWAPIYGRMFYAGIKYNLGKG
ncbi:MAG: TonB-dependent receptor [Mangrovibacterium sp.]